MKKEFGVEASIWNRSGRLTTVRKFFATEAAREKWLDKMEESGNLHEVRAFTLQETEEYVRRIN